MKMENRRIQSRSRFKKRLLELEGVEIEEDDKISKRYIIDLAKELLEK
jgi:hypothetical protein